MDGNNNSQKNNPITRRDLLAMERSNLANERTLLAYIRTSLTFLAAAAATLIQFFENKIFVVTGYFLVPLGLVLLFVGFYRYSRSKNLIQEMILNKY